MIGKNGNRLLLDTNIVVAYLNEESAIRNRLTGITATTFYLSSISLGELYYGAYKSTRAANNIAQIKAFMSISTLIVCDAGTADLYGQIKHQLKVKGRPIPENDTWIAAVARQYNLILVTRDEHFNVVEGLTVEKW